MVAHCHGGGKTSYRRSKARTGNDHKSRRSVGCADHAAGTRERQVFDVAGWPGRAGRSAPL